MDIKTLFGLRKEMGLGYYVTDFIFRRLLRQNAKVGWAVHYTSVIHCPEKLVKGKGVFPGDSPGVYINAQSGITIGDYSNIGPNVGIISANHDLVDNSRHMPATPITIGRFCWIGMGCVILPGITLGDFTITGAGAIVTHSFPDGYCVLAGNPARVIKYLNKDECNEFAASKK